MASDFEDPLSIFRVRDIPHYYGDTVRQLFIAGAVISLIAIPVWGDLLPFGTWGQVGGIVLLALLAGLSSPHGSLTLFCDAFVAGLGVLLLEVMAIQHYSDQSLQLFFAREAVAVVLLFAFYYAVKTLRAMATHQVGKEELPWEFEEPNS